MKIADPSLALETKKAFEKLNSSNAFKKSKTVIALVIIDERWLDSSNRQLAIRLLRR
jgi:hypothetical protein